MPACLGQILKRHLDNVFVVTRYFKQARSKDYPQSFGLTILGPKINGRACNPSESHQLVSVRWARSQRVSRLDPCDHHTFERERGDAGVLLIVVALAFGLEGGLVAFQYLS